MNYNNFINKDFRNHSQTEKPQRHPALSWMLAGAGCAVISVVLASTGTKEDNVIVIDETTSIQNIDSEITPGAEDNQQHSTNTT